MNRVEFMSRLADLLADLPGEERAEALQFYNGYFFDAGEENEQEVIRELGSPEALSAVIHREVLGEEGTDYREAGDFRQESGPDLGQETYRAPDYRAYRQQRREEQRYGAGAGSDSGSQPDGKKSNPWKVLAIIALCILFFPVILGVGGVLLGLVAALFALVFGLIAGCLATAFGCLFGGVVGLVASVSQLAYTPFAALLGVGVSLMTLGCGLIACWLFWLLAFRGIPAIWRGLRNLGRSGAGRRAAKEGLR